MRCPLTVGGIGVPEHYASKRRVFILCVSSNIDEIAAGDETTASCSSGAWSTEVDLNVFIRGLSLCPIIPRGFKSDHRKE